LRFADLLENLKSESGNCEQMKSRILFIKKERERVCVCELVQHLACEHGCWEGGDCGINPRVRVSPVRMACADLPSPSFANLWLHICRTPACLLITNDRVAASINGPDLACSWSLHDFPTRGVHGEQNYPAMISLFLIWLYIYRYIAKFLS
jgi:hypothetical protein